MTILLLGGTGRTATRIALLLDKLGTPYIRASRSSKDCKFDWLDESTLINPFNKSADITAVYLVAPGVADCFTPMKKFIDLARSKGVKRFVLLSASIIEKGGPAYGTVHEYLATLGEREGLEWAALRPTWMMENFSELQHLKTIKEESAIYSAAEDGKIPWISVHDIAEVACYPLVKEDAMNKDPILLGPELLSYDNIANILSDVLGRRVKHVKLSQPDLAEKMQKGGMQAEYANMLSSMDLMIASGAEARLNDVVEQITGKKPRKFRDFAEDNKACWM